MSKPFYVHLRRLTSNSSTLRAPLLPLVGILCIIFIICHFSTYTKLPTPTIFTSRTLPTLPTSTQHAPSWKNIKLLQQQSYNSTATNLVMPIYMDHIGRLEPIDAEVRHIWLTSAFLDTRSVLVNGPPEVVIQAAAPASIAGKGFWTDSPLSCLIAARYTDLNGRMHDHFISSNITVTTHPHAHETEKPFVPVSLSCSLWDIPADKFDWNHAEIYVTVTASPTSTPSPTKFLAVTPIPELDNNQHKTGEGASTLCLQPLVSDSYASSLPDFLEYYKQLGFDEIYMYLLDPGPITLGLLQHYQRMKNPPLKLNLVRWMLPKEWITKQAPNTVDGRDWGLDGILTLPSDIEDQYSYSGSIPGKEAVKIWAFDQNVAHFDCRYRAMARNFRWTGTVDFDEYLLLRPPSGVWPPEGRENVAPFVRWMDSLEPYTYEEPPIASVQFQSAFVCPHCMPEGIPGEITDPMKTLASEFWNDKEGPPSPGYENRVVLKPNPVWPKPYLAAVRQRKWFSTGFRSKYITDPWAYWTGNFHFMEMEYQDYAKTRCVAWDLEEDCAEGKYTAWKGVRLVPAPPDEVVESKRLLPTEKGTGAMYHLRVWRPLDEIRRNFTAQADKEEFDLLADTRGFEEIYKKKMLQKSDWDVLAWKEGLIGYHDDYNMTEDWSMLLTMGPGMIKTLNAWRETPVQRWDGNVSWIGAEVPKIEPFKIYEIGNFTGGLLAVSFPFVAFGVLLVIRRLLR